MRFASGTVATPARISPSSWSSRALKAVEVGVVVAALARVGLAEPVAHQLGVALGVLDVHPEVRVRVARGLREAEVEQPVGLGDRVVAEHAGSTAVAAFDASAMSSVGCSRWRPLTMIRSAFARVWASDGAGSNVCEFVASGISPRSRIRSPPIFRAIELIGATVVATSSLSDPPVRMSCQPSDASPAGDELEAAGDEQAIASNASAPTTSTRTVGTALNLTARRR